MGLGSEIRDPEKTYPGSGSRGKKSTGSRIRNTVFCIGETEGSAGRQHDISTHPPLSPQQDWDPGSGKDIVLHY
jgi:hypothetical protein